MMHFPRTLNKFLWKKKSNLFQIPPENNQPTKNPTHDTRHKEKKLLQTTPTLQEHFCITEKSMLQQIDRTEEKF